MKTILITLMLLAMAGGAFARIGETPEQLAARYGKAELMEGGTIVFVKESIQVVATMHEGKCVQIMFSKDGSGDDLSLAEAEALVKSNRGAADWKKPEKLESGKPWLSWTSADGTREAEFYSRTLTITDKAGEAAWQAAKDKRNAAKLKGF